MCHEFREVSSPVSFIDLGDELLVYSGRFNDVVKTGAEGNCGRVTAGESKTIRAKASDGQG